MRPINLIPPDERRGKHAPLRTGPIAYILLGALVALLAGVTALVLTGNQISEREAEISTLTAEDAAAKAEAERLSAYTQFRTISEQRVMTVASLADSRFDWERVMRELTLVLPGNVWLIGLTATATPETSVDGGSTGGTGTDLRGSVPGPALELVGCAVNQDAVAGFVTALKDIDGATRVGVAVSELPEPKKEESGLDSGAAASEGGSEECRTKPWIPKFEITVAFDAAPVPATAAEAEAPATPAPEEPATPATESSEDSATPTSNPEGVK
jgi:Tfp pilus assembly protein PilN